MPIKNGIIKNLEKVSRVMMKKELSSTADRFMMKNIPSSTVRGNVV